MQDFYESFGFIGWFVFMKLWYKHYRSLDISSISIKQSNSAYNQVVVKRTVQSGRDINQGVHFY